MSRSSASTISTAVGGPIALHLCKISYSTSPSQHTKPIWTHLPNRDDMYAVFDQIRRKGPDGLVIEEKILKVVRGGDCLEQIELNELRRQVGMDEERCRSQPVSDEHLFVIVLTRKPVLALRHRLSDGQIRRIQMHFEPASGFDIAQSNLQSAGLPIREKPRERDTVQRAALSLSQGAPQTSSEPRPQERMRGTSAVYEHVLPSPPAFHAPALYSGPRLPSSDDFIPTSGQPPPYTSPPSSVQRGDFVPPPRYYSRPLSAQDEFIPPPQYSQVVTTRPTSAPQDFRRAITYVQDRNDSQRIQYIEPMESRPDSLDMRGNLASVAPLTLPSSQGSSSQLLPSINLEQHSSSAPEPRSERSTHATLDLDQMLPPKRKLPFPDRPEKPPSQDQDTGAKSNKSRKTEPRKPKRKNEPATQKATKTPAAQLRVQDSEPQDSAPSSFAPEFCVPKSRPIHKAVQTDPITVAEDEQEQAPERDVRSTEESLTKKNRTAVAESSTELPNKAPLTLSQDTELNKKQAQGAVNPPPTALNETLNVSEPPARTLPQTPTDLLAKWAALNDEQCMKEIEDLSIKCIQDENFLKLMEFVEGCPKGYILGL